MREEDLALARRWLLAPHVRHWWDDDPRDTDYPAGTLAEWREAIRGEDPTDMFLIHLDARPIGVIQSYRVQDHPEYATQVGLTGPAIGVDLFIGDADLIGKGDGSALLREFVALAFDRYGIDRCVIGPTRSNAAAIRSYEKAGFRYLREYVEPQTREPEHVLLELRRTEP